ncbi:porin [Novosphingobium sp. KCTC 2891]|uniref:porin n=1 Tax=unclassified Novosphingobium TaxID=2644732 RepID=UPI0022235874|nr:porin [Novosphingobium sp. KCTC 2891]MCW1385085.1 porin [Novosphingobium sp. KCTC 2891]
MKKIAALLAATCLATATPAIAADVSLEAQVAQLKAQVAAQNELLASQAARLEQIEARLRAASEPAQSLAVAAPPVVDQGTTPASAPTQALAVNAGRAGSGAAFGSDTTIGGYGEITYNGYLKDSSRNQADLKRLVLFVGHRFSDKLSFTSEIEVEHAVASAGDEGEVAIEQAYLDYAINSSLNLKAGLFLMPFGFLNRSHEPPVFYGVERNEVETRIIPSTWREGGVSLYGSTPFGLNYDVGVTTGFDIAKLDDAGAPLAGSHQELQLAKASNLSFYGSLEYQGVPGLLVGGAVFSGNATHNNADFKADNALPDFSGITSRITLWDVHGRWQHKGFDFQALYARGTVSRAAALDGVVAAYNAANGTVLTLAPSAFYGWYAQGAYSIALGGEATLDPFVRYEKFDTQAVLPLGLLSDPVNRDRLLTTGLSFHPLRSVVVKVDYQKFFQNKDNNRFNLGLGYMF